MRLIDKNINGLKNSWSNIAMIVHKFSWLLLNKLKIDQANYRTRLHIYFIGNLLISIEQLQ